LESSERNSPLRDAIVQENTHRHATLAGKPTRRTRRSTPGISEETPRSRRSGGCSARFGNKVWNITALSYQYISKTKENQMAETTIQVLRKGPCLVSGPVTLLDADGKKIDAPEKFALCRCGASTKKPFCDGSHTKVGFEAAEAAVPASKE
jgi:3-phenylpropionate/trans-cinnamate dioxygenase ferredoxin subunit